MTTKFNIIIPKYNIYGQYKIAVVKINFNTNIGGINEL